MLLHNKLKYQKKKKSIALVGYGAHIIEMENLLAKSPNIGVASKVEISYIQATYRIHIHSKIIQKKKKEKKKEQIHIINWF